MVPLKGEAGPGPTAVGHRMFCHRPAKSTRHRALTDMRVSTADLLCSFAYDCPQLHNRTSPGGDL